MGNPEKKKIHENPVGIFWFTLVVCLILPVTFFIGKFSGFPISDNLGNWGSFGEYVGGFIGTIIAIANLYIFVKLTVLLADIQEKISDKEIESQRKIQLIEFRKSAILDLSKSLNGIVDDSRVATSQNREAMLASILYHELAYNSNWRHFQDFFHVNCNNDLLKEKITNALRKLKGDLTSEEFSKSTFTEHFTLYLDAKDDFLKNLYDQVLL